MKARQGERAGTKKLRRAADAGHGAGAMTDAGIVTSRSEWTAPDAAAANRKRDLSQHFPRRARRRPCIGWSRALRKPMA